MAYDGRISRQLLIFLLLWGIGLFIFYIALPKHLFSHHHFSTVLVDRNQQLLSASISKDEQWHFPQQSTISKKYKQAALLFEDQRFEQHNGFDLVAFIRAMYQNLRARKIVSGASTISMQTIRLHRNNPSRTIPEKLLEIILAQRLEWRYSKEEIFTLYAAHAPFGGNVIGLEAACWRFFGKSSEHLSWGEAALLAVLPNSPGLMHTEKNRSTLRQKRNRLLDKLLKHELISKQDHHSALNEIIPHRPVRLENLSPHLLQLLRQKHGAQLYHTSIDKNIQKRCLAIAEVQGKLLKQNQIDNLAILVLDIEKNQTLAYIGNLKNTGANNQEFVDIIQSKRSTGSLLKPFLYAAALEEGLILEKSLLPDHPIQMNGFIAENYNKNHDGLVPANKALIRSLNIPFAYLLQQYGIERFRLLLQDYGLQSINKEADYYGIPLILGGAEASLWDLTNAYGILAKTLNTYEQNDGYYCTEDFDPCSLWASREAKAPLKKTQSSPIKLRAESIWTALQNIQHVERPTEQGSWQSFSSSHRIAWKTGTSNGFKDAWAIGVNGKYAIGVWVGNADGEGRPGIVGAKAAAPIFFRVVSNLPNHAWFDKPIDDMQYLATCSISGNLANPYCPVDSSWLNRNTHQYPKCQHHKLIYLDENQEFQVNAQCYDMDKAYAQSAFEIQSKAAYYYKQNAYYKAPPKLHPDCSNVQKSVTPRILYPEENIQIYLPRISETERNKFVLKAFHPDKDARLYWHMDESFLGETEHIHEMNMRLELGKHQLMVIDQNGQEDIVHFEIVE